MSDCLFCRIVAGEIPADVVHSTERVLAFRDINPQAPTHVLVIPREHIPSLNDPRAADAMRALAALAREVAEREGIADSGWRAVVNTNRDALQSVDHVHLHVLGGRRLQWPPG